MTSANFDRIARSYRVLEYMTLGPALQRCRTYFLPQFAGRRHALVLGDGDGRFVVRLLAANRGITAEAVDTSPAMLHILRQRCGAEGAARLQTYQRDALDHNPSAQTDLIAAHFFFDCLTQPELDALIERLARKVRPDALWLVSDFRIPAGGMRLPACVFVRALYLAFGLLTGLRTTRLPNHEEPMRRAGLTRIAQRLSLVGLLTTELWSRMDV